MRDDIKIQVVELLHNELQLLGRSFGMASKDAMRVAIYWIKNTVSGIFDPVV